MKSSELCNSSVRKCSRYRLARVDAAFDMFQQACRIESSRERNEYVREALNEATRAKALLVRNFAQQQRACLVKCVTGVFIVVFPRLASGRRR